MVLRIIHRVKHIKPALHGHGCRVHHDSVDEGLRGPKAAVRDREFPNKAGVVVAVVRVIRAIEALECCLVKVKRLGNLGAPPRNEFIEGH